MGGHGRVDASREPHDGARRQPLLAEVVADPEYQSGLELRGVGEVLEARGGGGLVRVEVDDAKVFLEVGELGEHPAAGVAREGGTVEYQLVVAADLVDEDERHAVAPGQVGDHVAAIGALVHVPRGRREVQHQLCARARELARRVDIVAEQLDPPVLAHRESDAALAERDRLAPLGAAEEALLVEHVVAGKERLRPHGRTAAPGQEHRGVEQTSRAGLLGGDHRAEHDGKLTGDACESVEFAKLVANEAVALEQIHGRVAGEDHLGQGHQVGAGRRRALGRLLHQPSVSPQVSDAGVHLCNRDAHRPEPRGSRRS